MTRHELSFRNYRSWRTITFVVAAALSISMIAASALISILTLITDAPLDDFAAFATPVLVSFAIIALAALVIIATAFARRTRTSSLVPATLLYLGTIPLLVAAAFNQVLARKQFDDLLHSRALLVFWLLFFGLPLAALSLQLSMNDDGKLRRSVPISIVITVVGALVWSGIATAPKAAEVENARQVSVTKADVHPLGHGSTPNAVSLNPTVITKPSPGGPKGPLAPVLDVGVGFLNAKHEFINADTGTVRWTLHLPTAANDESRTPGILLFGDRRNQLILVSDSWESTTTAIDVATGDIRWTSALTLKPETYGYNWTDLRIIDRDAPASISSDGRTVRVIAPKDGSTLWSHTVPPNCAISDVSGIERLAIAVDCAGTEESSVVYLDRGTGKVTSTRESFGADDFAFYAGTEPIADRFIPKFVKGSPDEIDGVIDLRTNRTVVSLISAGYNDFERLESCSTDGQCLVSRYRRLSPDRENVTTRLVSLTRQQPDRELTGLTVEPSSVVWLRDQILWNQRSDDGDRSEDGLVVLDRATGTTRILHQYSGSLLITENSVTLSDGEKLYRFEGKK